MNLLVLTSGRRQKRLSTGLTSYWPMDEATGTRVDSVAGANLSMVGAVAGAAGFHGNAAVFAANPANYLQGAAAATGSPLGGSFTINLWVKPSVNANQIVVCKGYQTIGFEWRLRLTNLGATQFFVSNDGTAFDTLSGSTVAAGAYSMITAWLDVAAGVMGVAVNAGTPATMAHATGVFTGTTPMIVGTHPAGLGEPFSGQIDEFGFWRRVLSSSERSQLYGGGAGRFMPF